MNWSKAETEYVTTDIGYRAVAEKYKVSLSSVASYGKEHEWPRKRFEYENEVKTKAIQKTAEKKVAELSSFTERQNEIAQLLQDRVHMMLTGGDPLTSVDVLRLTNVWQILNNRPDDDQASGIMISLDQEMDEYAD